MSYLGSSAAPLPVNFRGVQSQAFSGTGSQSLFTLSRAVTLVTDIEVIVNNVQQSPFDGSYSLVNNGLGLQFSENVSAGTNNIYVIYRDQPMGSIIDPTAVRKTGDTMTGTLTVQGNILAGANSGGSRVYGVSGSTNTTVVLQAGAASGPGPNLELTSDHYAYLDSNQTIFRSTDGGTIYGKFDTAGRFTVPNQPAFAASTATNFTGPGLVPFSTARVNVGGHFNTSTNRFTAPVAGRYVFHYHDNHYNGTGALYADFYKNGAFIGYGRMYSNYTSGWEELSGMIVADLNVGDYIQVFLQSNHQADSGIYSMFCGYLLG